MIQWKLINSTLIQNENSNYITSIFGSSFNAFKHIAIKKVEDLIIASPNNYCLLDPVPISLIKNCASLLAPYVSQLFNRSLTEGYIPASQKIAVVKPHLKKRGLDIGDGKNFRRVPNLTFISKLLERIVCTQLKAHLESNSAFPEHHSAYWKFHSTESEHLNVCSDLKKALGKGHVALLELLDCIWYHWPQCIAEATRSLIWCVW